MSCPECGGPLGRPMEPAPAEAAMSREQRISFAYGNTKLSNPDVTREMVERAVDAADARLPAPAEARESFAEAAARVGPWPLSMLAAHKPAPALCDFFGSPPRPRSECSHCTGRTHDGPVQAPAQEPDADGTLHDRIHPASGRLIASMPVRSAAPPPAQGEEVEAVVAVFERWPWNNEHAADAALAAECIRALDEVRGLASIAALAALLRDPSTSMKTDVGYQWVRADAAAELLRERDAEVAELQAKLEKYDAASALSKGDANG